MLPIATPLPLSLPKVLGDRCMLRAFTEADAFSLCRALHNPSVTERLTNIPYPYTMTDARSWIASTSSVVTADTDRISFVIDVGGAVAGSVSFINLNLQQESAQISVWVAQPYWGQSLATEALQLLVWFGFRVLQLYRVTAFHVADNSRTEHLMDKLGFVCEGVHKDEWRKIVDGVPQRFDSLYYRLLRPEWEEGRP